MAVVLICLGLLTRTYWMQSRRDLRLLVSLDAQHLYCRFILISVSVASVWVETLQLAIRASVSYLTLFSRLLLD